MIQQLWAFLILFAGFISSFFIAYLVYCDIDRKNTALKKRISAGILYRMNTEQFHSYYLINSKNKKQSAFEKKHSNKNIVEKIKLLLSRADIKTEFSTLIMSFLGMFGIIFSLFLLNHTDTLLNCVMSMGLTLFFSYKILTYLAKKRKQAFDKVFGESLDIMVRSIKAGFSVTRSIALIAEEGRDPVKKEFQRITEQLNAGQPLEATLHQAADRVDLQNFHFFAVCLLIQSETGGNLSDALNNLIQVIRKRQEISLKIKALSSEARASAMIVGSLPFLAGLGLSIFNPSHMAVFYHTASGQKWIMIMLGMLTVGILVIRKLIRFKI